MQRLAIQRIGLASACKFGFILGVLLSIPSGIASAVVFKAFAAFFRALLESWQRINLGLVQVNLTNLLGLDPILRTLRDWDALTWLAMLLIVIAASIAGGALSAFAATFIAATYNLAARLSGGIEIETRSH